MEMSLPEILRAAAAALVLGGLAWTVSVVLRHYANGERPVRLRHMFRRLGLSSDQVCELHLGAHMPTAAKFCRICSNKGQCDAWLATPADCSGAPDFCPNASFLRLIGTLERQASDKPYRT
jgi:hypothetical protein